MAKVAETQLASEKTNIGLNQEQRERIVETLNTLLADESVLYTKTRNYHWNVTGPRFHDLHIFFEKQYTELAEITDEVAENVRQFGGFSLGTLAEFQEKSRLKEKPGVLPDADGMVADLLADHETIIREVRKAIKATDEELEAADAADFLTAILEQHNKMAWMLRSIAAK
jgi:starvation-inducible DNA-binding protein